MKNQIRLLLIAAICTFAIYVLLNNAVLLHFFYSIFGNSIGYYISYVAWPLTVMILASALVWYLLDRKIAIEISLAAAVMAFAFLFILTSLATPFLGMTISALAIMAAYFLSGLIFNELKLSRVVGIVIAVGICLGLLAADYFFL